MRDLSAQQALRVLEHGSASAGIDTALTLLQLALEDKSAEELASLSIGERDVALLELRAATFGPDLACRTDCPECAEPLEFALMTDRLLSSVERDKGADDEFCWKDYAFRIRLPSSADLAAAAEPGTVEGARDVLVGRCVSEARRAGEPIVLADVPREAIAALSEEMTRIAGAVELRVGLSCPACGASWMETLDIGAFLWEEVRAAGERVLSEVHALAAAYGWREADILAMSPSRRRLYVEMVTR